MSRVLAVVSAPIGCCLCGSSDEFEMRPWVPLPSTVVPADFAVQWWVRVCAVCRRTRPANLLARAIDLQVFRLALEDVPAVGTH